MLCIYKYSPDFLLPVVESHSWLFSFAILDDQTILDDQF